MKTPFKLFLVLIFLMLCVKGCYYGVTQPIITKEQQDIVVMKILRRYENIKEIKFLDFHKDIMTGFKRVSLEINNDEKLRTTISYAQMEELNKRDGAIYVNPINNFQHLERKEVLDKNATVDIRSVKVTYIWEVYPNLEDYITRYEK